MKRNEISEKAHKNAVEHGFWAERKSNEHCLMLICTEVAELVEADRKDVLANITRFNANLSKDSYLNNLKGYGYDTPQKAEKYKSYEQWHGERFQIAFEEHVKNTIEDEFADIYIRLADLAGALGVDFDKMQPCRYYRAFDRFSFTENAFALIKGLSKNRIAIEKRIQFGMGFIEDWAKYQDVNLEWHITQKMKYNQAREAMHGKKY